MVSGIETQDSQRKHIHSLDRYNGRSEDLLYCNWIQVFLFPEEVFWDGQKPYIQILYRGSNGVILRACQRRGLSVYISMGLVQKEESFF